MYTCKYINLNTHFAFPPELLRNLVGFINELILRFKCLVWFVFVCFFFGGGGVGWGWGWGVDLPMEVSRTAEIGH